MLVRSSMVEQAKLSSILSANVELYPSSDEEGEIEHAQSLTHKDVMHKFRDGLAELIVGDPVLNDLPSQVTVEEVNAQMALHYGQAMTVNVTRDDSTVMPVVIEQKGTVLDLKNGIKRYMNLKLSRDGIRKKISWRYIWRTYWLYFEAQRLTDDHKPLKEYGIYNSSHVKFVKKMKEK